MTRATRLQTSHLSCARKIKLNARATSSRGWCARTPVLLARFLNCFNLPRALDKEWSEVWQLVVLFCAQTSFYKIRAEEWNQVKKTSEKRRTTQRARIKRDKKCTRIKRDKKRARVIFRVHDMKWSLVLCHGRALREMDLGCSWVT